DLIVTGVQTCALPIFHRPRVPSRARFDFTEALEQLVDVAIDVVPARGRVRERRGQRVRPRVEGRASLQLPLEVSNLPSERAADRSGERRVGEGGRWVG